MMRILLILSLCLTASISRAADPGNAKTIFNEFIATVAPAEITYRTDIKLGADPEFVPAGRMLGKSSFAGYFTYRPKIYDELTTDQRVNLRRDNRFKAFLVAIRATMDGVLAGTDNVPEVRRDGDTIRPVQIANMLHGLDGVPKERRRIEFFTLTAEEMLQSRPIHVVLP